MLYCLISWAFLNKINESLPPFHAISKCGFHSVEKIYVGFIFRQNTHEIFIFYLLVVSCCDMRCL